MASLFPAEWTATNDSNIVNTTSSAEGHRNLASVPKEWPGGRPRFLPSDIPAPRTIEEATCLLNLAQTSRSIKETQKKLARQRAKECKYLAQLYELQAGNADVWISQADLDIGRVTSAVRRGGVFALPSTAMALRRHRSHGTHILLPSKYR
ncbi:hypothetical protein HWV62_17372 [Athelia sp. TMB]|nr:hypothetical protein HWV62_17372 [Athelia sp. TMB]